MSGLANIRFNALRNAIYHSSRRRFLDTTNRALSFVVVLAGTIAVGDLAGKFLSSSVQMAGAVAALAATLQLVFDLGGTARTHEFLQRRYYELIAEIAECLEPSPADIARWEAALNRLYAEEPPQMRALDAVAYNAAADSLGYGRGCRVMVTWRHALLKQLWAFSGAEFPWIEESKSSAAG